MGAGRGMFSLWWSGWRLNWHRARKPLEPQRTSLDEWELALWKCYKVWTERNSMEQHFLMQGLFLLNVSTSSKTLFKAHFGSFWHNYALADSNESIDSREKPWYLVAVENKERAGYSTACIAFSSNASNAMEPQSVITTDSYFNFGRNVKRKIRKCSIYIQMSNKWLYMIIYDVYFCQMHGPKMAAFLITLASNVIFMNLINEVGAVRLPSLKQRVHMYT